METLIIVILVFTIFNTVMSIAIAATVYKMINLNADEDSVNDSIKEAPTGYKMVDGNLVGPPTYDLTVLQGKAAPFTDGLERRLLPVKNWDGIS